MGFYIKESDNGIVYLLVMKRGNGQSPIYFDDFPSYKHPFVSGIFIATLHDRRVSISTGILMGFNGI